MKWNQFPITRYDENVADKFDVDTREQPEPTDALQRIADYCRREHLDDIAANPMEGIVIADAMLTARHLVGIVLGSVIRDLAGDECPERLLKHKDLDVLILHPHGPKNPAPNEGGNDWFVRPEGRPPTNGRSSLWYDVSLAPEVRIHGIGQRPSYELSGDGMRVEHVPCCENRLALAQAVASGETESIDVPPGLYLLDAVTVERIRRHCQGKVDIVASKCRKILAILRSLPTFEKGLLAGNSFRNDMISLLGEKCMLEAEELLESIGIETELSSFGKLDEHHFRGMERLPWIRTYAEWMRERLTHALSFQVHGARRKELDPHRFDYLNIRGIDCTHAALPILPHQAVTFAGL